MNGNDRSWDPQKLAVAAYYYNRAVEWGKPVSLSTKGAAYLAALIRDDANPQGIVYPVYTSAGAVLVLSHPSNAQHSRARVKAQATREQRRAIADVVIDNSAGLDHLDAEVERAWQWIQELRSAAPQPNRR